MISHADYGIFFAVLIPLVLFLAYLVGDLLPMAAFGCTAIFMIWALPPMKDPLLYFAVPLVVAVFVKMARGDKRGSSGDWRRWRRW